MYRKFAIWSFAALVLFPIVDGLQVRAEEVSDNADRIGRAASKSAAELIVLLLAEKSSCAGTNSARIKIEHKRSDQHLGWLERYTGPASGVNIDNSFLGYMRLQIADAALKSGCLDIANEQYRQVLNNYSSLRYLGLRDRAKVGIEDARFKSFYQSAPAPAAPKDANLQFTVSPPLRPGESEATYAVAPGETVEGILQAKGADTEEILQVTKLLGARGRPNGLLAGRQILRVVMGQNNGERMRNSLLRVEILNDDGIEAAVEMSNTGAYVAIDLSARN